MLGNGDSYAPAVPGGLRGHGGEVATAPVWFRAWP